MPRHQQVTTCLKGGGPVSKDCTCQPCTLFVCSVCGASEGGLTTDCPGAKVDRAKQQEVRETSLDYTDERGWHLATSLTPSTPPLDLRGVVAPSIDWAAVDRTASFQHVLTQKALAWAIADRVCEDQAAVVAGIEDKDKALHGGKEPELEARAKLARAKSDFQIACRRVEKCDEEFRQAARSLVALLEESSSASARIC